MYRYVGNGAWIPEVPARDLNEEETALYAAQIEATEAAGHHLYEAVIERKTTRKETVATEGKNDNG